MHMELLIRFDYGAICRGSSGSTAACATAGPDALVLDRREHHGAGRGTVADFVVRPANGCRSCWLAPVAHAAAAPTTRSRGQGHDDVVAEVGGAVHVRGPWRELVRAVADHAQGAHLRAHRRDRRRRHDVAARVVGSVRNWDYRYCWLRDAMLTLDALIVGATTTRRSVAGLAAARRGRRPRRADHVRPGRRAPAHELTLDWLPGTKVGAGARRQRGERAVPARRVRRGPRSLRSAARVGGAERRLVAAERAARLPGRGWHEPDEGFWEMRGPPHFTHSKVMAWVAFDRGAVGRARSARRAGRRWRAPRDEIHDESAPRASTRDPRSPRRTARSTRRVLLIPMVGFLPPDDPRCGTVAGSNGH